VPVFAKAPFDLVSTLHDRMTGTQALDALLAVYGDKGNGKSEMCMYLGERLDLALGKTFRKPPGSFFSIDNVRSIDPEGTLEMFTAQQFKSQKHQVFIVDDASLAANARKFLSENNQRLNAIMTVARIYRHCVILNTVAPELIDNVLRNFANITCYVKGPDMNPKSPLFQVNRLKVYAMSRTTTPAEKNKKSYNKYFQFRDPVERHRMNRITIMRTRRPSPVLLEKYETLRKEKTDMLIDDLFNDAAIKKAIALKKEQRKLIQDEVLDTPKLTKREIRWQEDLTKYYDVVMKLKQEGQKYVEISRLTGLPRSKIDKMIGYNGGAQ